MLHFWDIVLLWAHILIIGFNLFGWIPRCSRRLHLVVAGLTLFSWLILGIRYGLGYCFLTDWHWAIKWRLGESDLPNSFVQYFFKRYTGLRLSDSAVDYLTAVSFALAVLTSLHLNFMVPYLRKRRRESG